MQLDHYSSHRLNSVSLSVTLVDCIETAVLFLLHVNVVSTVYGTWNTMNKLCALTKQVLDVSFINIININII